MTGEAIGRADYELAVDKSNLLRGMAESDQIVRESGERSEKAYAESGKKAGSLFATAVAGGVRLLGAAAATAFGLAAAGGKELNDVVADFTAETGASEEAAKAAGKAINDMSARNIQPVKEIGSTLSAVHTELRLVGDEAADATQDFLTFARATKQDATTAVKDFDDILDKWNLTAKDARPIMDQLVASHQRYGGSISENQKALAGMAPALRAMNLTVDDGIGLLNFFASAGIDSSKAQLALNTAVKNMPPGENLMTVIERLTKIEDPAARAQAAIEVFGSKAGVDLANAIKPGMAGLDEFIITAAEAGPAAQKAADALDSSLGAKAQLLFNSIKANLTGFGKDLGPVLTGLGGLASLATSIGGPKLLAAFVDLGKKMGGATADGMQAIWQGASGTVIGNNIATRIENIFAAGETVAGRAARKAGAIAGAAWSAAMAAGARVAEALSAVFIRLPFAGPLRAAILASAITLGGISGTAFAAAAGAAIIAAPVAVILVAIKIAGDIKQQTEDIARQLEEFTRTATIDALKRARDGVAEALAGMGNDPIAEALGLSAKRGLEESLAGLDAAIVSRTGAIAAAGAGAIPPALRDASPAVRQAGVELGADITDPLDAARATAVAIASKTPGEIAQALRDKRTLWQQAVDQLKTDMANGMTTMAEIALIKAELAGDNLRKGLKAKDPVIRAQAQATRQILLDRLNELIPDAKSAGERAGGGLATGLKGGKGAVTTATNTLVSGSDAAFTQAYKDALAAGKSAAEAYAAGMRARKQAVANAAHDLAVMAANHLRLKSPAKEGPLSEDGGPEGWGARLPRLLATGVLGGLGVFRQAMTEVAAIGTLGERGWGRPGLAAAAMGPRGAGGLTGGVTFNGGISVTVSGVPAPGRLGDALVEEIRYALHRI